MRKLLITALLSTVTAVAQPAHPSHPIDKLVDHNRVLIVFAADSASPLFRRQLDLLEPHNVDMADRDLVLIPVVATWRHADRHRRSRTAIFTSPAEQAYLRERFKVRHANFTVILIGKDGGEKLRSRSVLPYERLASTIDSMPMRQQEMKSPRHH
ncbi:MAG: DUF4174 domain-containing protein [Granulicella sp.]